MRETCDRRGIARSVLISVPYKTPDGVRLLRTNTIRYRGPAVEEWHADYSAASIAAAWKAPRVRARMIRMGDILR